MSNDGKQDQILLATAQLSARLAHIRAQKMKNGEKDTNPSLTDIERSHVLFQHGIFKPYVATAIEYFKISNNVVQLGTDVKFQLPQYGDFINDCCLRLKLDSPTTSFTGTPATDGADVVLYRYCDWIGERIGSKYTFDVNSNPLDEYYSDTLVMHRQFRVNTNQMPGWKRNMGQQESTQAVGIVPTTTGVAPKSARVRFEIFDGFQEYKEAHGSVDLYVPLLFWFNTDPRLSFPSAAIPFGQRWITITLEQKTNLIRAITNPGAGSTISAPSVTNPVVSLCDLYVNNLFVMPDIHDIFISRISFQLIRVHRHIIRQCDKSEDNLLLNDLKWPIETLYFGWRPTANVTTNSLVDERASQDSVIDPNMEDWHRFTVVTNDKAQAQTTASGAPSAYNAKKESSHITSMKLSAVSIDLYKEMPSQFFNSYVPYTYGGNIINCPTDKGLYMITFALYPGVYQPSGHINASRSREFYLGYKSTYINSTHTADLLVNAVAENFLLVSDGSATVRYVT
jgi:hypothetical protein